MTRQDLLISIENYIDEVSAYENGKVLILCAFLIEVCKLGNYSADWILGRSEEKYRN